MRAAYGGGGPRALSVGGLFRISRGMIRFVLMVNKQGQTRLAQYMNMHNIEERCALEAEVIRKCLGRNETQCSFFEFRGYKVVYRRYASLFFIVGVEGDDEVRPCMPASPRMRPTLSHGVRAHSARRMSSRSSSSSTPWLRRSIGTLRTSANWISCSTSKRPTSSLMKWS